ncbi:MAG: 50S ribosomal protein L35 [Pseudomonadota bacterium]
MSKLKTKSSMKRRFRLTASGKIKRNHAGKRHFMRRRTKRFIRNSRGTTLVDAADVKMVKRLMPYG